MLALIMAIENDDDRIKTTEIYRLYSGTMLYIAKTILHDNYLAEDAVSEAFIRIIDNLGKINTINCYQTRGFVVIIVRNISFDILRRQKRSKTLPLYDYSDYSVCKEPVFDNVTTKEACSKIVDAISRLNKNYSDILYLKMEFNYSSKEISKTLGISEENAKMRLSRARKALKEQLLKEEDLIWPTRGKKKFC